MKKMKLAKPQETDPEDTEENSLKVEDAEPDDSLADIDVEAAERLEVDEFDPSQELKEEPGQESVHHNLSFQYPVFIKQDLTVRS